MFYVNQKSFANKLFNLAEIRLKRTKMLSRPVELTLEPTLECNSNCIMCNRNFSRKDSSKTRGFLDWRTFEKVRPFFPTAEKILFSGFGEPLLHPDYIKMLREIKKSGPYVYAFTNGILLEEHTGKALVDEGMDMICISMGGATRATYKKIRGVDAFDIVQNNIRQITKYKKSKGVDVPLLSFNIVAMRSILEELEMIVKLANDIGIRHISLPGLVAQGPEMENESLWLYRDDAQSAMIKASELAAHYGIAFIPQNLNPGQEQCKALFSQLNINWDGTVMSCAMERYIVGDLNRQNIHDIWNSKGMQSLRKDIIKNGFGTICPACTCWDNRAENYLNPWSNSRNFASKI